ncbi:hypothetical protein [Nannocystis pusilla]|uniref:hypothetical protein n=1 Tax=Nannocystis pusilla TaxID=889268 RepID=UPI003B75E09C
MVGADDRPQGREVGLGERAGGQLEAVERRGRAVRQRLAPELVGDPAPHLGLATAQFEPGVDEAPAVPAQRAAVDHRSVPSYMW